MKVKKVKINKAEATAIETWLKEKTKESLVAEFNLIKYGFTNAFEDIAYKSLNEMSTQTLVSALYNGYDVKMSVGDWVIRDSFFIESMELFNGNNPFQINGIANDSVVMDENGNNHGIEYLRLLSDEEIKRLEEQGFWSKLNRSFGEFKVGDIIVTDRNNVYKVSTKSNYNNDDMKLSEISLDMIEEWHQQKKVVKIYPVESMSELSV